MNKYIKERTFALDFAKKAFKGVLDKGGKPYIEHCHRIGLISYSDSLSEYAFYKEPEEAEFLATEIGIAGILHDVVEDTCISIETIELLFGKEVARIVDLLTRREGESYMQFIDRIKTCPKAKIIKRCDIMHNMDLDRLETVTDADLARVKKYEKALKRLESID